MTTHLTVIAGPPASGKTERLLSRYRTLLAENEPGVALWLAPTWRAAAEVRWRLLAEACDGCFSPGVTTFGRFAEAVLEGGPVAVRPLTRSMKRQLLRRLIDDQRSAGRLKHFRPIAETGGLVDLVCEWISELKRLEIWPEHFHEACKARGISDKDIELLEIYDGYQRCLREHELYDAEGCFWSARDLLDQGGWPPWGRLRLVVVDGFADFTRTQHEILEILARGAAEILIALPLEGEPRRSDLFTKPLKTLAELRRRHPGFALEELPRPERPDWPAMAHIERTLFLNPRRARPAADTSGVEIWAAARQSGEIGLIGSRIKRLLREGDPQAGGRPVRPEEIAVVFRSLQDPGSLVGDVFATLGIPVALETGEPLDRSPALVALVALLHLDIDDWPFGELLAVLGSNYFQPDWPQWRQGEAAVAAERTIRRLQVPQGREALLRELEGIAGDSGSHVAERSGSGSDPRAQAGVTCQLLHRLAVTLDELPARGTPAAWGAAWQRLAAETGLLRAIEEGPPAASGPGPTDRDAWNRLQKVLGDSDQLARWLGQPPPQYDRREALAMLVDVLGSEQAGQGGDEAGRVRVLSAAGVRALRIPYLFLAGLSEKAFPLPDREDRLYSEAEYQGLIEEGLPLVARTERNREEMLLFYEALNRTTRRLYLSYPAVDESAQPLSPSPYLGEVEQACGLGRVARIESSDLSPVPADDEPLSATAFRLKAVSTALAGDVSLLAGLIREEPAAGIAENLLAGLGLTRLRQDRDGFGPAEGILCGEGVHEYLAACFPPQRTFSATELEQYAACPYRFFLERVLKLRPVEELELAVDALERGRLAHEVLAEFHRRVNEVLGRPGSPRELDPQDCDRLLSETLERRLQEDIRHPLAAALREVNRRLLQQWTAKYADQCARYDGLWEPCDARFVPELFEVSFGRKTGGDDPASTEQPLEFLTEDGTVRISGRIDRVDTGQVAGHAAFNVLDYKTGGSVRFSAEDVAAGKTLQLPLYAIAVAELLLIDRDPIPWQAGYWYLKDNGFRPRQALKMYQRSNGGIEPQTEWEEIRGGLADTVAALVRGIRRGRFPVSNEDERCTGNCPYSTVCRINEIRSLEKTWQPAGKD